VATFIRFAVAHRDTSSDQQQGVFTALYALEDARARAQHQVAAIPFTSETF
jgi:hypothetical protein